MLLHVEVYVNVVASCVKLSENRCTPSMNSTFDVVSKSYLYDFFKYLKSKTNWACPGVELTGQIDLRYYSRLGWC